MKKAIHIDSNDGIIKRILSIADISAVENSPNGLPYISVDYVEPPEVLNTELDLAYPMYNTQTQTMFWQVVNYQCTASELLLENQNLKLDINNLQIALSEQEDVLASLLLEV